MNTKINNFVKSQLKTDLPDIRPGDTIRVYYKIKEPPVKEKGKEKTVKKERVQAFEGLVLAKKHGKGINATLLVRAIIQDVGVEKTFPLHSPLIKEIEVTRKRKTRRAKLYYFRKKSEKEIRRKLKLK